MADSVNRISCRVAIPKRCLNSGQIDVISMEFFGSQTLLSGEAFVGESLDTSLGQICSLYGPIKAGK